MPDGTKPFTQELQDLLSVSVEQIENYYNEFERLSVWRLLPEIGSNSRRTDHSDKTLDIAEAFSFYCVLRHLKATSIIELGTRFGVSSALLHATLVENMKEIPKSRRNATLIGCDLVREFQYIDEQAKYFTFNCGDAHNLFPSILETRQFDCLFNDAHPYTLIKKSTESAIENKVRVLAFHDVGKKHRRSSFNRESYFLSEEEKIKNNLNLKDYGYWERHVMAEIFGERILDEDSLETVDHKVQIFDSLFGLGIAVRKEFLL